MPTFILEKFAATTAGLLRLESQTPGKVNLKSKSLEVRATLKYRFDEGVDFYVGFVQICTANAQVNHYGAGVEQRWEFKQVPVSDSANAGERPWYGDRDEAFIGGLRRLLIKGPNEALLSKQFNMSDFFRPGIAKFEALPNGAAGPNQLSRITRDQSFRLWFVSVKAKEQNQLASYTRLAQVDWRCEYDVTVAHAGTVATIAVVTDSLTVATKQGHTMDPLHTAAFTAPTANDNQKLRRYVNGVKTNTIVARIA